MPAANDALHEPVVVALQDADVLAPGETPAGVRLARLITKGATGADLTFGACWMAPGETTSFDLSEPGPGPLPAQEAYYVISGRVRVSFGDRRLEAGPQAAIWFPPGREYRVEAIGDDEVFLVYTVVPAAR